MLAVTVCNGRASNGKQNYLCRTCHRQRRENPTPHAYSEERREEILRAYEEHSSLRGLERTFGVTLDTYEDVLEVTEAEPLAAYAFSLRLGSLLTTEMRESFLTLIRQELAARRTLHITTASGMFVSLKTQLQEPGDTHPYHSLFHHYRGEDEDLDV